MRLTTEDIKENRVLHPKKKWAQLPEQQRLNALDYLNCAAQRHASARIGGAGRKKLSLAILAAVDALLELE